ncbi:MAG: YmaF family protein [Firmicutes bacterium]|nr:YmaF family protein [Bacillota bacterium]
MEGRCCFCGRELAECRRHRSQRHVHELVGGVEVVAGHGHQFATVSGEAIPVGRGDHVHEVEFRTDFFDNHFHTFRGRSGGMIRVGDNRHVHFAQAQTSRNDGHSHGFRIAALINNPTDRC